MSSVIFVKKALNKAVIANKFGDYEMKNRTRDYAEASKWKTEGKSDFQAGLQSRLNPCNVNLYLKPSA
jgi:hypothetical protein